MEGMVCDARGEGDGGDGLQCTGRFGGKLADLGNLGISEFREIGIQNRGKQEENVSCTQLHTKPLFIYPFEI
ncbi:hypothetical protein GOBAR_AA33341 [Gossypium barbadense]|uniref:Uncharacterized protein n=1 Tax=Gossypium barbadense TaxID=3634 RepID=A0A2P5W8D8_GOSBA|nr:hypothetical protein GOBAR_AA33341 [Gossypium barbadense]